MLIRENLIPPDTTEGEAIRLYAQLSRIHALISSQKGEIGRRLNIPPNQDVFGTIGKRGIQKMIDSTSSATLKDALDKGAKNPMEGIILPPEGTDTNL